MIIISTEERGTEFTQLKINHHGREYLYTGKTANAILDAMDEWAEQRILALKMQQTPVREDIDAYHYQGKCPQCKGRACGNSACPALPRIT